MSPFIEVQGKAKKERVVILGSGWAGYGFSRILDPAKYEPIIVSPRSYFVFTPLLASTAVGTLEFRTVLEPIRRLQGARFYQGWADDVDLERKIVRVETNIDDGPGTVQNLPPTSSSPQRPPPIGSAQTEAAHAQAQANAVIKGDLYDVPYDKLVVAVGAYSQTFGISGVREYAHFLRDVGDARRIRLKVLSLFELCSYPDSAGATGATGRGRTLTEEDRRSLLHFAIVGGGPTGIEFAAELHDLIYEDLAKIYPNLLKYVRITVYDVAPKVLPMFDQALAKYAMDTFKRQGIEVKTEHHLEQIRPAEGDLGDKHGGLRIKMKEYGDEEVGVGLVVWSTGLMQNPFVEKLLGKEMPHVEADDLGNERFMKDPRTGGIITDEYLRARLVDVTEQEQVAEEQREHKKDKRHMDDVFVIGDCAVVDTYSQLPKTAQVASQQAVYLAKMLNRGRVGEKPFTFSNWGTLTYLGSWKAIHQGSRDRLRGWVAWVVWRGAYLTKSMSWRNKLMVPVYWFVSWLFGRDISRF